MAEARLFQALSDPTRLKIVGILADGPRNVTGIVDLVKAAQPAVSRHLRILREAGLIHDRRLGKQVEYSLDAGRVSEACGWLGDIAERGSVTRAAGGGTSDQGVVVGDRPAHPYTEGGPGVAKQSAENRVIRRTSGEPGKGRLRRISPLAARRGEVGGQDGAVGEGLEETPAMETATGVERAGGMADTGTALPGETEVSRAGHKKVAPVGPGETVDARAAAPLHGKQSPKKARPGRKPARAMGAGVKRRGSRPTARTRRPSREKPRRKAGGVKRPRPRPTYRVEHEKDELDDFLL